MRQLPTSLFLVFQSGLLFGCTTTSAIDKPLHEFPSVEKLRAISTAPRPAQPISDEVVGLEDWTLELPEPPAGNPARALLGTATPQAKHLAGLDCVAHEIGRIALEGGNRPSASLAQFIAARCGAGIPMPSYRVFGGEENPKVSDAAIVAKLRGQLTGPVSSEAKQAGAAIVRSGKKVAAVVAFGSRSSQVQFEQLVSDKGVFQAKGRVQFDTDGVQAFINVGEFGVKPCLLDPAIEAPLFVVSCELDPKDDSAWVDVLATPRGQVLARPVLSVIAVRSADAARRYQARTLAPAPGEDGATDFETAALKLLNRFRARAGLSALKPATAQSKVASSVTPAFFAAMMSPDGDATNIGQTITLGLLAGWDVHGGIIQNASLSASVSIDSTDCGRWLADASQQPMGRMVLFDPAAHAIAFGVTKREDPAILGVVSVAYRFFQDETDPLARATRLLDRLARVRAARGLGRTVLVRDAPGMEQELARIHDGATTATEALNVLMQNMFNAVHRDVRGFIWETHDLDAIEFPKELLQEGDIVVGAGITHHRANGGAWGQYSVLFVVIAGTVGRET